MSQGLFSALLLLSAVAGGVLLLISLIGANVYDLREAKKRRDFTRHPHAARYRRRPLISIVVTVRNDAAGLEQTVSSIIGSSYRKSEIIIADNASDDTTKKTARALISGYPKRRIKLFAGRAAADSTKTAAKAYKSYGRGELVMVLPAGQTLARRTLMETARQFNSDDNLGILVCNQRVEPTFSVLGLLQGCELLLSMRAKKLFSLVSAAYVSSQDVLLYRKEVFGKRPKMPQRTLYYDSSALVFGLPPASLDELLRGRYTREVERLQAWIRLRRNFTMGHAGSGKLRALAAIRLLYMTLAGAVTLLAPVLFGYFVYLAIRLHQPVFFELSLIVLSIVLLLTIWGDEHLRFRQKLASSAGIPANYGLFCLYGLILPLALLTEIAATISRRKPSNLRRGMDLKPVLLEETAEAHKTRMA